MSSKGVERVGEQTHEHGMVKPGRRLGLINFAATATGPIRRDPKAG
jgi:hypothetical protein